LEEGASLWKRAHQYRWKGLDDGEGDERRGKGRGLGAWEALAGAWGAIAWGATGGPAPGLLGAALRRRPRTEGPAEYRPLTGTSCGGGGPWGGERSASRNYQAGRAIPRPG
jgi:hypothetical protein